MGVVSSTTRPYRGVSAADRKADRRAKLLDAGLELLGTVGWEQTTMTAVCAGAKLTERYFYESFANREDLAVAVVDLVAARARATVIAAMGASLERDPDDPHAAAVAAVGAFVDLLTDDPRTGRAVLVESAATDALRRRRHELLREFASLVVEHGHALFGPAAVAPPRDEINALMFVGGLAELLTTWLTGELDAGRDDVVAAAADRLAVTPLA